jgi:hypothetical protein
VDEIATIIRASGSSQRLSVVEKILRNVVEDHAAGWSELRERTERDKSVSRARVQNYVSRAQRPVFENAIADWT